MWPQKPTRYETGEGCYRKEPERRTFLEILPG